MKIKYFQQGGTNTPYRTLLPDQAFPNEAKQQFIDKWGQLAFDKTNLLADNVYANFINSHPIQNEFTTPIQRSNPTYNPVNDDIVNQVIKGKFGNGQARIDALTKAGYDPKEVQRAVNAKFKPALSSAAPVEQPATYTESYPLTAKVPGYADIYRNMYGFTPTDNVRSGYIGNLTITTPVEESQPLQNNVVSSQPTPSQNSLGRGIAAGVIAGAASRINPFLGHMVSNVLAANTVMQNPKINNAVKSGISAVTGAIGNAVKSIYNSNNPIVRYARTYVGDKIVPGAGTALDMVRRHKEGGNVNFLQQGGALAYIQKLPKEQQQQLLQAFGQWAKQKGIDVNLLLNDPNALDQALEQFMQEMQVQQAQKAEKGAKLQFIKSLRGICPEGEELTYMKKGGVMCPVCKKKQGGEAPKAEKKEFFGKDKKVNKALMGIRLSQYPDSVTVREKVDNEGNGFRQETFPNDSVSIEMFGKRFPGFSGEYGNAQINISPKGKKVITEGATLPVSVGNKLSGADSAYIDNKYKEILNNISNKDNTFKVPLYIPSDKNGGKAQFFKKEPKAPLAKCGKKVMAKCGCKAKKKK